MPSRIDELRLDTGSPRSLQRLGVGTVAQDDCHTGVEPPGACGLNQGLEVGALPGTQDTERGPCPSAR